MGFTERSSALLLREAFDPLPPRARGLQVEQSYDLMKSPCCSCACGEKLAVGCSYGGVVLLDRSLHVLCTIAAFEGNVVAMQFLEVSNTVLTSASCRSMPTQRP